MLECGANDIETGTSPAATVSLISTIISKIEVQQPTDIILAGLTPINIPNTAQYNYNSLATEVNSMLPAIATTYKAEGYPVSYVDMYSKMNVTNASGAFALITPVQDHPNNGGYEEMSKLWLPPLVSDIRQIQAG
jgi:lysophospholipase L1-like esterase